MCDSSASAMKSLTNLSTNRLYLVFYLNVLPAFSEVKAAVLYFVLRQLLFPSASFNCYKCNLWASPSIIPLRLQN